MIETVLGNWVSCSECDNFEDCSHCEDRDGCFHGVVSSLEE